MEESCSFVFIFRYIMSNKALKRMKNPTTTMLIRTLAQGQDDVEKIIKLMKNPTSMIKLVVLTQDEYLITS